jgi:hypothetical protein
MFHLRRDRIVADQPRHSGIVFECALENKARRKATVFSQEYELWFAKDLNDPSPEFITRLSFDLFSISTNKATFDPNVAQPVKLIWHFSADQLQYIEDLRQGKEPWFQIRNRLTIQAQYLKTDGITFHGEAYFAEESAPDLHSNMYPMRFKIDHEEWAKLLNDVGFSHIFLHEFTIPRFPPELKRAQEHLKEAWGHHRGGRERPALQSCFNAFECLGFDVTGKPDAKRTDVLARLMDGKDREKQRKIKALWKALGEYCHLGRHDKGSPVRIGHRDGELAVVSATMLLRYLAEP